jgi:hypothetical protein
MPAIILVEVKRLQMLRTMKTACHADPKLYDICDPSSETASASGYAEMFDIRD